MADHTGTRRPEALDADLLSDLRGQMESERAQLRQQILRLGADFRDESWKEPRSDDDAETGSATFERERTISLAQNSRSMVARIDRALARMDAGTYGLCSNCGRPIDRDRLLALPHAGTCMDCQRRAERSR
jgi:DnaK suppressor protein